MILYSAPPSYYSMIARLALNESHILFDTRYMDIHIAKEQLRPWYVAINPAMTVPTLTEGDRSWTDSRDILKFAATSAANKWEDSDLTISPHIEKIVAAHYALSVEKLTFGKVMVKFPPMRKIFPIMLKRIIKQLEAELETTTNPLATQKKIAVNQERLSYFTNDNLVEKLNERREDMRVFLSQLPQPQAMLFGEKISSADIVSAVLIARLNMIGENDLMKSTPAISSWFERIKTRAAFASSDIWLHFKPWRIILKY